MPEAPTKVDPVDEMAECLRRRRSEAMEAGMDFGDAQRFAESGDDIGWLRKLVELHCPPELLSKIL